MPTWRERHWRHPRRDWNPDDNDGPWSPYNRDRDDRRRQVAERDLWAGRGRDYWLENDQDEVGGHWDEPRTGDPWRRRDDPYEDEDWGNQMGLRDEPIERPVPRAGAWEREPRYSEMERMRSDRDDRRWSQRRDRPEWAEWPPSRSEPRWRDDRDDYQREAHGEQYPSHRYRHWSDDRDRGWRGEQPRDRYERRPEPRYEPRPPPSRDRDYDARRFDPRTERGTQMDPRFDRRAPIDREREPIDRRRNPIDRRLDPRIRRERDHSTHDRGDDRGRHRSRR
jgi:hypothetical protein